MNILSIDTSNNKEIVVTLTVGGKGFEERLAQHKSGAEETLILIEKLLKESAITLKDIEMITVHTGPGSFTGLRVGVAIANALSFSLGIPVNDKKNGEIEIPIYNPL